MHNNKKNEELQTRREFFKKAAKGALPILGAIVLAGTPGILAVAKADAAEPAKTLLREAKSMLNLSHIIK